MNEVSKVNLFLMWKLPSAFITGVRAKSFDRHQCTTAVTYRWINQNPFQSMYFAVQAMAAELSTGVLVTMAATSNVRRISTLVTSVKADFKKKATGRILFTCDDGDLVNDAIDRLEHGPQTIILMSIGRDSKGEIVSVFEITWSLKMRQS